MRWIDALVYLVALGAGAAMVYGLAVIIRDLDVDVAPHMERRDDPLLHADILCGLCKKGAAAVAPTLTEAYSMVNHWRTTHACVPSEIPTTGGNP